jgi:hypothetical protein
MCRQRRALAVRAAGRVRQMSTSPSLEEEEEAWRKDVSIAHWLTRHYGGAPRPRPPPLPPPYPPTDRGEGQGETVCVCVHART